MDLGDEAGPTHLPVLVLQRRLVFIAKAHEYGVARVQANLSALQRSCLLGERLFLLVLIRQVLVAIDICAVYAPIITIVYQRETDR